MSVQIIQGDGLSRLRELRAVPFPPWIARVGQLLMMVTVTTVAATDCTRVNVSREKISTFPGINLLRG